MAQLTLQQAFEWAMQRHQAGERREAERVYRQILAHQPKHPGALHYLGLIAHQEGRSEAGVDLIRQALALAPDYPDAYNSLGLALAAQECWAAAAAAYRQAVALNPQSAEVYNNLGQCLGEMGLLDEAVAALRQALALKPAYPKAYANLAGVFSEQGLLDDALAAHRQGLALNPDDATAHSDLIFLLHFHPGYDGRALAAEQRTWWERHGAPLRKFHRPHANERNPDRRLRIGYVSPDFRNHVVGLNVLPLVVHHDRPQFAITCYSEVFRPDAVTAQFQQQAEVWRAIGGRTDEEIAAQIREDGIDILVDLTMHMGDNRLLVFARKPAPVQVTFAAYPGSTGVEAIDYRLSDPYLDPPGMDESIYSERTVRLPDSFWCYEPMDGRKVPVHDLPALSTGHVTFGCLNNFCKINPVVLALWAQVLQQLEGSRLMLMAKRGCHRQRTAEFLASLGVAPERIEFVGRCSHEEYLALYHRLDIGLDSFPYNGHTTSLDSFWMGVPVVTLMGPTVVSRAGWCQLSNLGLPELAGQTPEQFVQIAVDLAADLGRLRELRAGLRARMEASPLMDARRFARNIEAAYRSMWQTWCASAR